jgi:hypothetical protein
LNTFIPLPWQRLISEWCDCDYRNPWTVKEYCSLFIDTGHSLWRITIMPLIKVYNIDSDLYGLKGHSIFKSVCNTEASWRGIFGQLIQTASAENRLFLQDLRRRSIVPTPSILPPGWTVEWDPASAEEEHEEWWDMLPHPSVHLSLVLFRCTSNNDDYFC